MFEHFLITRFNLLHMPGCSVPDRKTWIAWTNGRFSIFQNFCLPSIINQTNKKFKWLIYFDATTPSEFDDQINSLMRYDFIDICYANGYDDFQVKYSQDIQQRISSNTKWIITSRLDNDDCLHCQAIERIQKEFIPVDRFMISLTLGYVYSMESQKLSKYYYPMSPFISLIEKSGSVAGIFQKSHIAWDVLQLHIFKELYNRYFRKNEKRKVCFVLDDVLWIQLYHGGNVSNSFYKGFPVLCSKKLNDFGIDHTSQPSRIMDVFKYRCYSIWKRYFKASIVRLLS